MAIQSKYLRISITNRCNMKCVFCHREGNDSSTQDELTADDIVFVAKIARDKGFKKVKLTGGEPTIRVDLVEIVQKLVALDFEDFSIVTNGSNLGVLASELKNAGLKRLNVTINTLNEDRFRQINQLGPEFLRKIQEGVVHAIEIGFSNIKINFVYTGHECDDDLDEVMQFASRNNLSLVLLPVIGRNNLNQIITLDDLYDMLKNRGIQSESLEYDNEGIARRQIIMDSGATVILRKDELIDHEPFDYCSHCVHKDTCREGIYPVRLSANGKLIPCLAGNTHHLSLLQCIKSRNRSAIISAFDEIASHHQTRGNKNDI